MRRKRYNKGDILIDLTSLLDIIFIVLLIVICNQQNVTNKFQAQQAEALRLAEEAKEQVQVHQKEYEELTEKVKTQLQLCEDQIDTVNGLCLVSVNARYDPNNVTTRHITILKNGKDIKEIDMIGNNTAESLKELESILREYIDSNAGKPIILSLNEKDENILYRDEKAIQKIFHELKDYSEDVYIK